MVDAKNSHRRSFPVSKAGEEGKRLALHPHRESVVNAWHESGSSKTERRGFLPPPEEEEDDSGLKRIRNRP